MTVESGPSTDSKPWLPYLLIAIAVLFAHGLALRADFYMNDKAHILTSERIQDGLDALTSVFRSQNLTYDCGAGCISSLATARWLFIPSISSFILVEPCFSFLRPGDS